MDKPLFKEFVKEYNKLYDLYNLCYGDKSNELFDELHDMILYQINGYNEEIEEGAEIRRSSLNEIKTLVKEIEKYYRGVTTLPKIHWVYG